MSSGFRCAVTSIHASVFSSDLKALAAFPAPLVPKVCNERKTSPFMFPFFYGFFPLLLAHFFNNTLFGSHSHTFSCSFFFFFFFFFFFKFLHAVLDELCSRVPSYDVYQDALKCRPQDILRLKNGYKLFVSQVLGRGLKSEDILADLKQAGLNEALAGAAGDVIVSRYEEVRIALSEAPSCGPYLKDFDWKLNLTVASDKFATLAQPTSVWSFDVARPVSDLEVAEDPESKTKAVTNVVLEMNQTELKKFVEQLETVAGVMRSVA